MKNYLKFYPPGLNLIEVVNKCHTAKVGAIETLIAAKLLNVYVVLYLFRRESNGNFRTFWEGVFAARCFDIVLFCSFVCHAVRLRVQ